MRRFLTGLAGAFGLAALWRGLRRRRASEPPAADPAEELRRRLAEARDAADDRDEFDAAEGVPVDQVDEPRSLDERRDEVHRRAREALGEMRREDEG